MTRPHPNQGSLVATVALIAGLAATAIDAPDSSAAGCPNADKRLGAITIKQARAATFCLLNKKRAAHGLVLLEENAQLRKAARKHSQDMVAHHYFSHVDRNKRHSWDRAKEAGYPRGGTWYVSENIFRGTGQGGTPKAAVAWWMGSDMHRKNILDPNIRDVGIGIAQGVPQDSGSDGATYTTDFGFRH